MPEKQKINNWKNPKTIITAASVTGLLTLWNTFASHDRQRSENLDLLTPAAHATAETKSDILCRTPANQIENMGQKCVSVTNTRSS